MHTFVELTCETLLLCMHICTVNALLGDRYVAEGVLPTTVLLTYCVRVSQGLQRFLRDHIKTLLQLQAEAVWLLQLQPPLMGYKRYGCLLRGLTA
jgi:hypothetical protein